MPLVSAADELAKAGCGITVAVVCILWVLLVAGCAVILIL